jgi:hypothetical protein
MSRETDLENLFAYIKDLQNARAQIENVLAYAHVHVTEVQDLNCHSRTNASCWKHRPLSLGLESPPTATFPQELPLEVVVLHASCQWRMVALQTPQLCTGFSINLCTSPMELLDFYLKHSVQHYHIQEVYK